MKRKLNVLGRGIKVFHVLPSFEMDELRLFMALSKKAQADFCGFSRFQKVILGDFYVQVLDEI